MLSNIGIKPFILSVLQAIQEYESTLPLSKSPAVFILVKDIEARHVLGKPFTASKLPLLASMLIAGPLSTLIAILPSGILEPLCLPNGSVLPISANAKNAV